MTYQKKLIVAIASSLAGIAVLVAASFIVNIRLNKDVAEANELKGQFRYWLQAAESISVLRNDYRQVEPYLDEVDNLLPERDELIGFSKAIADLGSGLGVSAGVVLGLESLSDSGLRQTNLTLTASGEIGKIISFISALSEGSYFIRINNLDLSREGDGYRLNLTGGVFSR